MKIYLEQVLFTNLVIDFCILIIISKIVFSSVNIRQILYSSIFGSMVTLIYPYCTNILLVNALKILTAIIMLQILGVKTKKQVLLSSILMLIISYIFGGAILSNFGYNIGGSYAITNISLIPIFAICITCTVVSCKLITYIKSKITTNSNIYNITLVYNCKAISIKSFIDSGNGLYDNNNPVSLINFDTFTSLTNISLEQYLINDFGSLKNAHFISANTIAGKRKILVFNIDELHLTKHHTKIYKNVTLGVAMNFDNTKEYKAILNSCFCFN